MLTIVDFSKGYIWAVWRALKLKFKILAINPKYVIRTYFDTKLSLFGLAHSDTEEVANGPLKGHKDPQALCRS